MASLASWRMLIAWFIRSTQLRSKSCINNTVNDISLSVVPGRTSLEPVWSQQTTRMHATCHQTQLHRNPPPSSVCCRPSGSRATLLLPHHAPQMFAFWLPSLGPVCKHPLHPHLCSGQLMSQHHLSCEQTNEHLRPSSCSPCLRSKFPFR